MVEYISELQTANVTLHLDGFSIFCKMFLLHQQTCSFQHIGSSNVVLILSRILHKYYQLTFRVINMELLDPCALDERLHSEWHYLYGRILLYTEVTETQQCGARLGY